MATANEVETRIGFLKNLSERYKNARTLGPNRLEVDGRTVTTAQLQKVVSAVDKQIADLEKKLAPLRSAQAELARAKEIQKSPLTESPTGMSQQEADRLVAQAQQKLDSFADASFDMPASVPGFEAPRRGGIETVEQAKMEAARQPAGVTPKPGTKPEVTPKPSTTTKGRGGKKITDQKVTPPKVVDWEPKFREMFPTQAWLLDLDRTKYADVFKLFQTAIDTKMYETQEGLQRFAAQLDNTSFYKELATTGKAREIRNLVGDLGFDTVPFNKFLTTSMNFGWEGDTLRQEVYKEAFRKDVATGQYVNPTAVKRVKASNPYLSVKAIGSAFFSTVDDNTVEQRLTGGLTDDDVVRQQRELAKGKYAHLATLLDQGLTLEGIASSYRDRAAAMLEKNPNEIDMGSADFAKAFNYGEEGKKRMMGDGEWEILLRSDPRYGWTKTQNAKQEARQIAASISQAFGRTL